MAGGSDEGNRRTQNLQGLLRMAIQNTGEDADPATRNVSVMDPERRAWLSAAIDNSGIINLPDLLRKNISILGSISAPSSGDQESSSDGPPPQASAEELEQALEELLEWVDSADVANDFYKMGGFPTLRSCLLYPNDCVRSRTAELVAELVQNNPTCQQGAQESNLIPVLLHVGDKSTGDEPRIKAFYAMSCLSRDNAAAQQQFIRLDGHSVLLRAMQSDITKLRIKSALMLTTLCTEQPSQRSVLVKMGFVEQLVALLQHEHDPWHEYLLMALNALVRENPEAIQECRRSQLRLKETLEGRIDELQGKEEFAEEVEYCQQLLHVCFPAKGSTTGDEDR